MQEPWQNLLENTTINHPAYHLVFPNFKNSRTCIYVSKSLALNKWESEAVPDEAKGDITSISLQTKQGKVQELGTLRWIPRILSYDGQHILVGDFNLHHYRWGGQVPSHHKTAEDLLEILESKGMKLILPEGTITWKSRNSQSTLDLAFTSNSLEETIIRCHPSEELESSSDHLPLITELQVELSREAQLDPRPQWKKADWSSINQRLSAKLSPVTTNMRPLTSPAAIDQTITEITRAIQETVEELVPKSNPSPYAKPYWTEAFSQAVKATRKARREWTKNGTEESWIAYRKAANSKKSLIKKEKLRGWRVSVMEATKDPQKIWKLAKWARKDPEEKHRPPQIPDIVDKDGATHTSDKDKALAMASHFFPPPPPVDIRDIEDPSHDKEIGGIPQVILDAEVEEALSRLADWKAPGPDKIPGILLKNCRGTLKTTLTKLFNACISQGYHPKNFKESITVVIRKPQKPRYDTPRSYRPIALLNIMGKLLEKVIARWIANAAEKFNLLPEEQMGGRPHRSTITALELLTEQVYTVWDANKNKVASLLSLDISGAFDNVPHQRLIHTMRTKGIPRRVTNFVKSFLSDRTTSIKLGNYIGEQTPTSTGIPQGSPLSPILFLFFASTLPLLNSPNSSSISFVDDTNLLTWSDSTEENCRTLEKLHKTCEGWAKKHGARFAPEKYQLIHFSRKTKRHNLQATLQIQGHETQPKPSIRILGIHLDPRLNWGAHMKRAQQRAETQLQSITRLTYSTWGANFSKARVLYSAIVRP
ncbi:hypothetical protein K3495_g14350, partial [Podosphaera aphanis]